MQKLDKMLHVFTVNIVNIVNIVLVVNIIVIVIPCRMKQRMQQKRIKLSVSVVLSMFLSRCKKDTKTENRQKQIKSDFE